MKDRLLIISLIGLIAVIGNWIGFKVSPIEALPGIIVIIAITLAGWGIAAILPFKSPAVVWISLVALIVTSPIFPGNAWLAEVTGKLNFMALATPILAYAGLSLGKDIESFKRLSWRIVVVSLVVYTGTFLFAALFAEMVFRIQGKF
ncbi:hypothetical protein KDJ56_12095 [Brevibacillus composti]|uniref:DUF340 domain-containing protein n=1 Tax=Brevibacillus composti TaxID=2796470 RepID=A0A7T5EHJ7_9BACL|nr:hypothetical protein [Brevibacillus composti]QQE72708.1 hypothetical protein JD108_12150 [Brevibacillus composti]QUO39786.1 hypothetical protein KDJ56_12095 [Brevibacillus composti]